MKRTTVYLDPDLEVLLKLEMRRQGRPMAEIVREAVQAYVTRVPHAPPPGAGEFASGRSGTAADTKGALADTGFGAGRRARRQPSARARRT